MTRSALIVIALSAAVAAAVLASPWGYLIAPGTSLRAVERDIERAFPDVSQLHPETLALWRAHGSRRLILVDVRGPEEFAVSRIEGAVRIDPGAASADVLAQLGDRASGADIVLYCSVGQRSSSLARRAQRDLIAQGAQGVHNLRGGLFAWRNAERPIVDGAGPTERVHPYDETWGRLLKRPGDAAYFPGP